jgi:hypothetical protein
MRSAASGRGCYILFFEDEAHELVKPSTGTSRCRATSTGSRSGWRSRRSRCRQARAVCPLAPAPAARDDSSSSESHGGSHSTIAMMISRWALSSLRNWRIGFPTSAVSVTASESRRAWSISPKRPTAARRSASDVRAHVRCAARVAAEPDDLPPRIREAGRAGSLVAAAARRQLTLDEVERMYILQVLQQAGGNRSRAAELLGLDRKTLYRKLEEYRAVGLLPPLSPFGIAPGALCPIRGHRAAISGPPALARRLL